MSIRKISYPAAVIMLALCCLLFTGCKNAKEESGKLIVAVTIVPQETFVREICGDLVDIITLVPPGSSPESYEPTPKMMEDFSRASVYFSIGVPAEEAYILPLAGNVKTVSLAREAASFYPDRLFGTEGRDPHIWLSPKRAIVMVRAIAMEMGELDPENRALYLGNADSYIKRIEEVDRQIRAAFEEALNKKFIVYHPSFGYFADEYGLVMYSLEEEGKLVTARHIKDMTDLAKKENIKVIYYQDEIDVSQCEAFAEEIGGVSVKLSPLSADYIGNLERMAKIIAGHMK